MIRCSAAALAATALLAACGSSEPAEEGETAPEAATPVETAEPEPADLSVLFTADSAADCDWLTDMGERVIREDSFAYADDRRLEPVAAEPFAIPELDQTAEPRLIAPREGVEDRYEVRIDLDGEWLGLDVEGVGYRFLPGTDYPDTVSLYLAEPVEEAARTLAGAGFPVNPDGSVRRTVIEEDGVMYDYFGLVSAVYAERGETVFHCTEAGWDAGD